MEPALKDESGSESSDAKENIKIFIHSWNMGNAPMNNVMIAEELIKKDVVNTFQIVCFGLQESTYSMHTHVVDSDVKACNSPSNDSILKASNDESNSYYNLNGSTYGSAASTPDGKGKKASVAANDCFHEVQATFQECLGPRFKRVAHLRRGQMQMFMFARDDVQSRISQVEKSVENTGFLGIFPNKGGLLCTFRVDGTKLAFVSCHLTAHEGVVHCAERNASTIEILGGVRVGDKRFDVAETHHHIFWMGDMNYRSTFDEEVPTDALITRLEAQKKVLLKQNKNGDGRENLSRGAGGGDDRGSDFSILTSRSAKQSLSSLQHMTNYIDLKALVAEKEKEKEVAKDEFGDLGSNNMLVYESDEENDSDEGADAVLDQQCVDKKKQRAEEFRKVHDHISYNRFGEIVKLDELTRELKASRCLAGFTALTPNFPPTFKRIRHKSIESSCGEGDNNNDGDVPSFKTIQYAETETQWLVAHEGTESSNDARAYYDKKRLPSFTDRILYKSMAAFTDNLTPLFFESVEYQDSSDHKPVISGFQVRVCPGDAGVLCSFNTQTMGGGVGGVGGGGHNKQAVFTSVAREHCLRIKVSNLACENLKEMDAAIFGGGSDPYVMISTDPSLLLVNRHRTKNRLGHPGVTNSTIRRELNPVWSEPMLLQLASIDLEGLAANCSMLISVWDEDSYSWKNDLIGVNSIPLRDVIASYLLGKPYHFKKNLRCNGELTGTIKGTIEVQNILEKLREKYNLCKSQLRPLSNGVAWKSGCTPDCCKSS